MAAPDRPPALGIALSSFIGREKERSRVLALIESARLVTLTGAGGVGKTRLARADTYGDPSDLAGRACALHGSGVPAMKQDDNGHAAAVLEQSLALYRGHPRPRWRGAPRNAAGGVQAPLGQTARTRAIAGRPLTPRIMLPSFVVCAGPLR